MQLTRGKVIDTADPEARGRIRVAMPATGTDARWIDVATPAAGPGHGLMLEPVAGDVALVAALDRRGRDLVVIGFLWTAEAGPRRAGAVLRARNGLSVTLDEAGDRLVIATAAGEQIVIAGGIGGITIDAAQVTINAGLVTATGVLKCDTLIANAVNASSYTPGAGNIW